MKITNALRAAAALALSTTALAAGQAHAQGLSLGVDVGVSMATFSGERIAGLQHRAGPVLGVSIVVRPDGLLSLETGANWIRKGARGTLSASTTGFDEALPVDLRLDYVQLPALARFYLPAVGTVRASLFAGPAVAFDIGCSVQTAPVEIAFTLGCGTQEYDRSTDWSLLLGGGIAHRRAGGWTVRLDGRYDLGLTNLDQASDLEVRNRGFVVTTGMSVPIGGSSAERAGG